MNLRQAHRLCAWGLLLAVAGCAPLALRGLDRSAGAGGVQSFTLSGRLSIRQGEHNDVVRIDWQHDADHEQIALSTPLGTQVMALDSSPGHARLQLPNRPPVDAADEQALMQAVLGYALPVRGLADWVSGRVPESGQLLDQGTGAEREVHFVAQGWQGSLQRWRAVGPAELPGLVAVQREDLSLRLVVDQWTVQRAQP